MRTRRTYCPLIIATLLSQTRALATEDGWQTNQPVAHFREAPADSLSRVPAPEHLSGHHKLRGNERPWHFHSLGPGNASHLVPGSYHRPLPSVNDADSAWVLVCTILVLMMSLPGLAMFYSGLMRQGSVNSMLLYHIVTAALVSVLWVAFGYSLAFSTTGMVDGQWSNVHAYIGALDKSFLSGVSADGIVGTIPEQLWVMFQMTFAIIAPCIMAGAVAERMKFSALMMWTALWVPTVYFPVAHMVWSGRGSLLGDQGALDFAGGLVVHMTSGFSGLVGAVMVGPSKLPASGHSLPMCMMGVCLLWVGWMGFNVGSALTAGSEASTAMLTTQTATASAVLTWCGLDCLFEKKASLIGACSGVLAGLVVITPGAGYVGVGGAMAMGVLGAVICRYTVEVMPHHLDSLFKALQSRSFTARLLERLKIRSFTYDDRLDAFGVHGMGGLAGNVLTAVFAQPCLGGNQASEIFLPQLNSQVTAAVVVVLWSMGCTAIILALTRRVCGSLRADARCIADGMDGELKEPNAYTISANPTISSSMTFPLLTAGDDGPDSLPYGAAPYGWATGSTGKSLPLKIAGAPATHTPSLKATSCLWGASPAEPLKIDDTSCHLPV